MPRHADAVSMLIFRHFFDAMLIIFDAALLRR